MVEIRPQITFRHMEHSELLEANVLQNLEKITKFLVNEPTPISLEVVFDSNPLHPTSRVEILLISPHYNVVAHATGVDMYELIDIAVAKLQQELGKAKERRANQNIHGQGPHRPG